MANLQLNRVLCHLHAWRDRQALAEASDAQLLERFTARQEEAAFAALVRRHGAMVLSVSRRVLHHLQDAEDVFQATFLLLARKARSIRKREAVASWLHGVAHRLAVKAKAQEVRRQAHERRAADRRDSRPRSEAAWRDVQAALDAALAELPPKYRAALVLCCLEGKTLQEAARLLGCAPATVGTWVARGRALLRARLTKNGLTLSTAGLATLLIASAAPAAAPAALAKAAVQAAVAFAAGQPAAALCSEQAASLVEGGLRTMFFSKVKTAAAVLLIAGLVVAAALAPRRTVADEAAPSPKPPAVQAKSPAARDSDSIAYSGRVLGPDGRPVAGARLYVTVAMGYLRRPAPSPEYGRTGPDGRFRFTVPSAQFADQYTVVTATATGHGPGWVQVPAGGRRDDLTLRLVKDDVPITGQVVDLEGKPVRGATLTVMQINAAPGEDLGPWLRAAQDKKGLSLELEQRYLKPYTIALAPKVTTDAAGRFRLSGIGRDRLVWGRLDGPTIASQQLHILTRPGKPITLPHYKKGSPEDDDPGAATTYHGADFRYVAAPTKPIIGVVRDKDTNKPLAGVTIRSQWRDINGKFARVVDPEVSTPTDAGGRFRLTGMPKGDGYKILAIPRSDQPYVVTSQDVPDTPGLDPVTVDFALKRGVWITGKVTDKVTGQPVRGSVEYFSFYSNPNLLRDHPGFIGTIPFHTVGIKEDGSYRVVGLPGPGLVAVLYHQGTYLRAPDREDEYGTKKRTLNTAPFAITHPVNYNALAWVDPARGAESVKRDVTLDPGWALKATVLGPDGKPLAGARVLNLNSSRLWWGREGMKTAEFTGWFHPRRPRDLVLRHPEKGLVGVAQPPKENGGSVTVRMGPGATVTGRLIDADGKPQAGAELELRFRPPGLGGWYGYLPEQVRTDRQGRFRVAALLPDYEFRLSSDQGELSFRPPRSGQAKDLGDVRMKPAHE
jgi:RNA polymerase sigma factor (sigma-70 family)